MMELSLLHLKPYLPPLPTKHHHHHLTTIQAHLPSSPKPLPKPQNLTIPTTKKQQEPLHQQPVLAEDSTTATTCVLPKWVLPGGISLGVAVALILAADVDAHPAMALGPEGPLVEEFWDNMRRYALYIVTVSTGAVYTVLQPVVELLKNPITALLIVVVVVGSGFLVSQVLNAMAGNSDFTYNYAY